MHAILSARSEFPADLSIRRGIAGVTPGCIIERPQNVARAFYAQRFQQVLTVLPPAL
jgi:hypothetical protein